MKKSLFYWLISSALTSAVFASTSHAQNNPTQNIQHSASGLCVAPMAPKANANTAARISLQEKCHGEPEAEFHWSRDGSIRHVQTDLCLIPRNKKGQFKEGVAVTLEAACDTPLSRFRQNTAGALVHESSRLCLQPKTAAAAPKAHMQLVLKSDCSNSLALFQPVVSRGADADADGVFDSKDRCPDTPPNFPVDTKGCPLDFNDDDFDGVINSFDQCPDTDTGASIDFRTGCVLDTKDDDRDGVINTFDNCANTPLRSRVDETGCPIDARDTDKDQVPNFADICPGTPKGALIDEAGCPLPPDADGDNVADENDLCPNTPEGTQVDFSTGCPFDPNDDDNDGINNSADLCPNTPAGAPVDFRGCPLPDEDGDGVPDDRDGCSGTAPGISVDFQGCPLDADFDGIPDSLDQCPRTEGGVVVTPIGCPLEIDEDQDSVPDQLDLCPGTPAGDLINPQGCPGNFSVEILGQNLINGVTNAQLKIRAEDLITSAPVDAMRLRVLPVLALRIFAETDNEVIFHSVNEQVNGVVEVPVFFEDAAGATSNVFRASIDVQPLHVKSSLIIHDNATLNALDLDLVTVFDSLAASGDQTGAQLFRQFWDTQLSTSTIGSNIICNTQFNGFPIVCDRPEATFTTSLNEQLLLDDMRNYRLLAVVNRMELHNDWQDCGEHRLVYGHIVGGRNFLIFEARLPNATPGQASGCANAVNFWQHLSSLNPQTQAQQRADALRAFFIEGTVTGAPVITAENFMAHSGQIRTNQFFRAPWLLRENKLQLTCDSSCRITAHPVTVKENPFGELFNPSLPSDSPFAALAQEFQTAFVENIGSLTTGRFIDLKNELPDKFNNGQSHSDFPNLTENDFTQHFGNNMESPFASQLLAQLQNVKDARGEPLSVAQIINRSTALTCGGCHQPGFFNLTQPGSIGAMRLPNGEIIDSWPDTLGFVHVDEGRNLSQALERVFLPVRLQAFVDIIDEVNPR